MIKSLDNSVVVKGFIVIGSDTSELLGYKTLQFKNITRIFRLSSIFVSARILIKCRVNEDFI